MLATNQISHLLNNYGNKVIGKREVLKAITSGRIKCVILAEDVDADMLKNVTAICLNNNVKIHLCESKRELGHLSGIEVACACIGLF